MQTLARERGSGGWAEFDLIILYGVRTLTARHCGSLEGLRSARSMGDVDVRYGPRVGLGFS